MATILSNTSLSSQLNSQKQSRANSPAKSAPKNLQNPVHRRKFNSSELLGIAASVFRSPAAVEAPTTSRELAGDGSGAVDRAMVVETIKDDFQRSYFVTGALTLDAYEEDCEFVDPAGSFRGLRRFKRNCTNFGSLIEKSNMKLTKREDFEEKGIGHWRFSCIMSFPWKPNLSATGYTEYYYDTLECSENGSVEATSKA